MRKVIGIGLPKTGTSSLRDALAQLDYQKIASFNMEDCRLFLHGDIEGLVGKLADFDGAQDWPWPLLYQPLYRAYPDALFVLTLRRDESVWIASLKAHANLKRGVRQTPGMRQHILGYEDPADNPDHHVHYYRTHNNNVRQFFAAQGTLIETCWENGDGWPELCDSLGLPHPDASFPHANKRPS